MTQEKFHHIATINNRLAVLDASIKKFERLKLNEYELSKQASQSTCTKFCGCPVYRTGCHPLPLSYVKLVIKDYNSREVELSPCEWHTLIEAAIERANAEKNIILKEIESL